MPTVSVVVITLNEEKRIDRCLQSARWADEIVVVDSFSSDQTVDLARRYTEKVYQHEYRGSTRQMEKGIGWATGEWILFLDADEEISVELATEIRHALQRGNDFASFEIVRKPRAFGRWIEHGGWYPDHQLRLVRKDSYVVNHAEVHGGFTTTGRQGRLRGVVYHYTYDTITDYVAKMNDYTSLQVSSKLGTSVAWYNLLLSPLSHFLTMFFSRKGFKDGFQGFLLSVFDAMYALLLYSKVWEYERARKSGAALPPITNIELNRIKRFE